MYIDGGCRGVDIETEIYDYLTKHSCAQLLVGGTLRCEMNINRASLPKTERSSRRDVTRAISTRCIDGRCRSEVETTVRTHHADGRLVRPPQAAVVIGRE